MSPRAWTQRVSLRNLIFLLLLVSGLIPLAIGSFLLTRSNIEVLETQEQDFLTRSTHVLSEDVGEFLGALERQLEQLGEGLLVLTPAGTPSELLAQPDVQRYFGNFLVNTKGRLLVLSVLDREGVGPSMGAGQVGDDLLGTMGRAFDAARDGGASVYEFVRGAQSNRPFGVLAVPVRPPEAAAGSPPALVLVGAVDLDLLDRVEAQGDSSVFLVDAQGRVLWAAGADDQESRALSETNLVRDFRARPLNMTQEYTLYAHGRKQHMLGRVSPVPVTGWGVVVQKPVSAAYTATRQLVSTAVVSSGVLVLLALAFGAVAAKRFADPIHELAESSHEIAEGNFGKRVQVAGPGREVAELADDFNRMSGHVERYVKELEAAARANQELFIGSIRAFAAAVDAKDPYTRGHSERVASFSRTISRYLGLDEKFQQRIWIAGVLHDVGKIGIEDRILKKGGVLSTDEYEIMKLHPVIGYDILLTLEPLKEMLPAIRWHHEAWNGRGYPDGLKGEGIPLIARVVAVADTFDAITTNRPYQKAYTPEYAVETITKLTGARFDAKVVTAFLRAFQERAIVVEQRTPEEGLEPVSTSA
jgi:HD-GYP domain-containing protein (c-di-GMP phosphodiesterase class II)